MRMKHATEEVFVCIADPWVKIHLAPKEAGKVFWRFQEFPGKLNTKLPTHDRYRRPLTMPVVRPSSSEPQV